jgi:hypothetical protein
MRIESNADFIERELYPQILDWLEEREIVAIAGPRQAGKTTLLLKIKERLRDQNTVLLNFEDSEILKSFSRSPREFIELYAKKGERSYFLLDEFQYVKDAGKILKLLFDQYPEIKFIITGSSSLKIRQIASFLVGRVVFFSLYPLSFAEYLSYKDETLYQLWLKFNQALKDFLAGNRVEPLPTLLLEGQLSKALEGYLIFGGYPAVVTSAVSKKEERLKSLVETYIEKDIVKFLQIGNYLEFRDFTGLLASRIGNLINYSSLGRDAALSYREVKKFLGALEKTFVVQRVAPYFTNKTSEIRKSPKVYFVDLGLRNSLIDDFRSLALRPDRGALVENFVFQNLLYRRETGKLNFWRTRQGAEVDFVLKSCGELIPIEVKYRSFANPKLSRSFKNFLKRHSEATRGVVLTKDFSDLLQLGETRILFLPVCFV